MEKVIATGVQDFEKLRVNQCFYVDKTDFISKWWNGGDDVTLITRPRRFGKTLNMSTLSCFFSNIFENRGELFEGLEDKGTHLLSCKSDPVYVPLSYSDSTCRFRWFRNG